MSVKYLSLLVISALFASLLLPGIGAIAAETTRPKEGDIPIHFAGEKPSLKAFSDRLVQKEEITALFKSIYEAPSSEPAAGLKFSNQAKDLWRANDKVMKEWLNLIRSSATFVRGDIDGERTLSSVLVAVQLSILQSRRLSADNKFTAARDELSPWFLFASDIPYEEASLISLRLSNLIRSLLLDELEFVQKKYAAQIPEDRASVAWATKLRSSWPIDRVILSEAKRLIKNQKALYTAQQVAVSLQKNSYQTAAVAIAKAQGPKTPELKFLIPMWREQDILAMKTEVHRIAAFRIRCAEGVYRQQKSKDPTKIEDLVSEKILDAVPLDYSTGKPFTLTEAALH